MLESRPEDALVKLVKTVETAETARIAHTVCTAHFARTASLFRFFTVNFATKSKCDKTA